MNDTISVQVPDHTKSYDIVFFETLDKAWADLKAQIGDRKFLAVTDENVARLVSGVSDFDPLILPAGESEKNMKNLEKILEAGFEKGLDRHSVMIAMGGGVIGDMTGFAASVYMRGIPVIQVPTTLLSMVDSSIGGKTGVDCPQGKNLIGAFHPPEKVIIPQEALNTLPQIELKNGIGEMVKHGILGDPKHFEDLESMASSEVIPSDIFKLVPDSIAVKHRIVETDEREAGVRGFLNLGHTFGHAIEHISQYAVPHGQAVAIGCVMAANFALEKGLCEEEVVDRIESIFHQFEIETMCEYDTKEIFQAMEHDKKKKDGKVRLILPKAIGAVDFYEIDLQEYC